MAGDHEPRRSRPAGRVRKVTLKDLARELDLSPATISVVLNRTPAADSIPAETQERIFAVAEKHRYLPNLMARSLRAQRSHSVGVLAPEIVEGYAAGVLGGIEGYMIARGYFTLVASHRSDPTRLHRYLDLFKARQLDGLLAVNTPLDAAPGLPTVAVAGHHTLDGVTNVVIDHARAARLAIEHLVELGHREIAVFKGHPGSADTEDRWQSILAAAREHRIEIRPELTVQLSGERSGQVFTAEQGHAEGYLFGQRLLERGVRFTALFAFNDISAIGAMRAFFDSGLPVPERVSVIGFDDIQNAAFQNPSLTTIRQPLQRMGELAAEALIRRLEGEEMPDEITVEPELIVRESTARVAAPDAAESGPAVTSSKRPAEGS